MAEDIFALKQEFLMKLLCCIPKIMAVEPAVNCWGPNDPDVQNSMFIYPFEVDWELRCLDLAEMLKPDLIILFAFVEGEMCPVPDKIKLIKEKFPIVYIATDGGCAGMATPLKYFKQTECFTKIVNIDGMHTWPEGTVDLVTLSPLDFRRYEPNNQIELKHRPLPLGFMGGSGAIGDLRRDMCDELVRQGLLTLGRRDESFDSSHKYVDFMLSCQAVINFPQTGRGQVHIKSRTMETGLAKACLLEQKGSPLNQYLIPGEDYLEWDSIEDIQKFFKHGVPNMQEMADRMHEKVRELTNPTKWVQKVLAVL